MSDDVVVELGQIDGYELLLRPERFRWLNNALSLLNFGDGWEDERWRLAVRRADGRQAWLGSYAASRPDQARRAERLIREVQQGGDVKKVLVGAGLRRRFLR